jgi:putative transposase
MLETVELRFATIQAPHAVEWLSDNGSPFTAKETPDFAAALGLVPCFSPVHSPEPNGIAEAFVKTFKRDYARIHPLPDAATVLRQIVRWFDDYNESHHPHSGFGIISPREFHSGSSHVVGCPVKRGQHQLPAGAAFLELVRCEHHRRRSSYFRGAQ